ncbi:MAG: glycosyltransferase family 4 protein, partial [Trebonia sp.]
ATFHTSMAMSRARASTARLLQPSLEKLSARIAVSEQARQTAAACYGSAPVVIPNGLFVERFASDGSRRRGRLRVAFVGRLDEPRKGFGVLAAAWPAVRDAFPEAELVVVGSGDVAAARRAFPSDVDSVRFLGAVSESAKAATLAAASVYVAPHLGGESFGIVLAEAMAAGAAVVASDLPAFRGLLVGGEAGVLVPPGDAASLATAVVAVASRSDLRQRVTAVAARRVRTFDWDGIVGDIEAVYGMVAQERRLDLTRRWAL